MPRGPAGMRMNHALMSVQSFDAKSTGDSSGVWLWASPDNTAHHRGPSVLLGRTHPRAVHITRDL